MEKKGENHAVFETKIKTNLNSIARVMEDTSSFKEWLHACKEVKLLQRVSQGQWILYFRFDVDYFVRIPLFFLNDPFLIAKATMTMDNENQVLTYRIGKAERDYDIGDKADQIENFDINWQFLQQGDSVAIRYEFRIEDKAPFLVRFLLTNYIEDSGFHTLDNLCQRVRM